MPVGSVYRSGLFMVYAYKFRVWGFSKLAASKPAGSTDIKRPMLLESYLAPKLSRPVSVSRSLPVKCMGLGSAQEPEVDWPSPKGRAGGAEMFFLDVGALE